MKSKFFLLCFALLNYLAKAQPICPSPLDWHPAISSFDLGDSFDTKNPNIESGSSFTYNKSVNKESTRFNFNLYMIHNELGLKNVMQVDANIDARYMNSSVSFDFSMGKYFSRSSNSLTLVLSVIQDYRGEEITPGSEKIRDEVKNLSAAAFRKQYGTHYVKQLIRGYRLNVFMTINGMKQESVSNIRAAVGGNYSSGFTDVSGSASFQNLISEAIKNNQLSFRVEMVGNLTNVKNFSQFINLNNISDYNKLTGSLQNEVQKLGYENSTPVKFVIVPLSNITGIPALTDKDWTSIKEQQLHAFYQEFWKHKTKLNEINRILNGEEYISSFIDKSANDRFRTTLTANRDIITSYIHTLTQAYNTCKQNQSCTTQNCCIIPKSNIDILNATPELLAIKIGGDYPTAECCTFPTRMRTEDATYWTDFYKLYRNVLSVSPLLNKPENKRQVEIINYQSKDKVFLAFFENYPTIRKNRQELEVTRKNIQKELDSNPQTQHLRVEIVDMSELTPILIKDERTTSAMPDSYKYVDRHLTF